MKKKFMLGIAIGLVGIVAYTSHNASGKPFALPSSIPLEGKVAEVTGSGTEALRKAAKDHKHLFLFFYEKDDALTRAIRRTLEANMGKVADSSRWIALDKKSSETKGLIEKYHLSSVAMPFVFVVAPNGAFTGKYRELSFEQIQKAIASPVRQACLKATQDRNLVLLCIRGSSNSANEAALRGAREFKSDPRFASFTEIVTLDSADPSEESFLKRMNIEPKTKEPVTLFIAPPGTPVATIKGATTKQDFVAALGKVEAGPRQ